MAKNWKPAEAAKAIKSGDKEAIRDIGGRFPIFAITAAQLNDAGMTMVEALPDYITVRKLEAVFKGELEDAETETEEAEEEKPVKKEKPAKEEKPAKPAKVEEDEDEEDEKPTKTAKDLFNECKKAGLDVEPKKDIAYYEKALKKEADRKAKEAKAAEKPAKAKKTDDDEDWNV